MGWSFPVGRILGTQVRIHLTFLPWLAFWAWQGWKESGEWTGAAEAAGLLSGLFACVLLHEFGHVLMARRYGIRTRDVTLLPIGGVARMESTGETPRQELWIALAGPAVNVVIAAIAFALMLLFPATRFSPGAGIAAERALVPTLFLANLTLLAFNLVPAFPMDGGRVLRALLSWRGDRVRATRIAVVVGRAIAVLFAAAGFLLPGNNLLVFVAVFVWIGAGRELAAARTGGIVHGVPVRAAMLADFRSLGPFDTLADAARAVLAGAQRDFPVVDGGGLVGLLRHEDLLAALRERGEETLVRDVMAREYRVADPAQPLDALLRSMLEDEGGAATVPVVEAGRLVGLVTPDGLGEYITVASALGHRP